MSYINTLRRQGDTRTRFVFPLFVAAWLSLVLQPCATAATVSVESAVHTVVNVQVDPASAESRQDDGRDDCRLTSATGDCCCTTPGIHDGSDASKRSLSKTDSEDRSDTFAGHWARRMAPESIIVVNTFNYDKLADSLPAGPPINMRNCVYLI